MHWRSGCLLPGELVWYRPAGDAADGFAGDKGCFVVPDDEKPQLILEPEKPENKGKFVVAVLPEWRFYLKFISIQ